MKAILAGIVTFVIIASFFISGLAIGRGVAIVDAISQLIHGVSAPQTTTTIISRGAVIEQIRRIQRLETTTYTIERIIVVKQTDSFWPEWLRGERLLLVAHGDIVAGVDLAGLNEDNVIVAEDGQSVVLNLPAVAIFNPTSILDNEKTYVYDRQRGIFSPFTNDLETTARREADKQLLLAACEGGILRQATTDAQRALERLLALLEMDVTVNSAPVPACPVTPS
jgi:hypothetical protein